MVERPDGCSMGIGRLIGYLIYGAAMGVSSQQRRGKFKIVGESAQHRQRIGDALDLICKFDPIKYRHLNCHLRAIWAGRCYSSNAHYLPSVRTCVLDIDYIDDPETRLADISCAIVHEATHARLMRAGIGYDSKNRVRVEQACVRRELAFARLLGDEELVRTSEWQIEELVPHYSEVGWATRDFEHRRKMLHALETRLGAPRWVVRLLRADLARRIRRHRSKK